MSDNRKYYYIKLKDNYFDQDNIIVLESVENGYIYSNIILKMYLKSIKFDGKLMMTERIPYDPTKINILSNALRHDPAHVEKAIKLAVELDLITILDSGEIFCNDIQNFIGHSSTEADRKREYRVKIKEKNNGGQLSGHVSDERTPEREIDIKREIDKEIDTKKTPAIKKSNKKTIPGFDNITLSDNEIQKLNNKFDTITLTKMYEKLSNYKYSTGKNYKSDYHTLIGWVKDAIAEKKQINKKPSNIDVYNSISEKIDRGEI